MSRIRAISIVMALIVGGCVSGNVVATTTTAPTTTSTATSMPSTTAPPTSTTLPSIPFTTGNLGLAAVWLTQLQNGVAFGIGESAQGSDLNGDGDTDDVLAFVLIDDLVINTGLGAASGVVPMDDGGFLVHVFERDVGMDLTGDGDVSDYVPHIWHPAKGVTNVGIHAWATPGPQGTLWLEVVRPWSETFQVWHPDGRVVETGWTGGSVQPRSDGSALIGVFEEEQGVDLDGDGRLASHVVILWAENRPFEVIGPAYGFGSTSDGGVWLTWDETDEAGALEAWHLGFWHPDREFVDLALVSVSHTPTPDGGLLFWVSESLDYWSYSPECARGDRDLNGDGDCDDLILHRWDPQAGLQNLGLVQSAWCPECDWGYVTSGNLAFVAQVEAWLGMDLDGDGKVTDVAVLQLVEGNSVRNLVIRVSGESRGWAVLEGGIVVPVPEIDEDLNGDGALTGHVFHFVSNSGTVTNLGLAGWLAQPLGNDSAALMVGEEGNGRDLNGDGLISADTCVVHIYSPSDEPFNTGVTTGWNSDWEQGYVGPYRVGVLADGRVVVRVPEELHGHGDLNGDGDTDDLVVYVIESWR